MADDKTIYMDSRKSTKSDSGLCASLLAGSEELFDFTCQPCTTENLHIEAVGYCQDCDEYLYDTCYNCHRKTTALRHHKLLDKADMPKNKVAAKPTDDLTVICSKHKKKLIEYWCNSHKDLCCVICLKTDHDMCKSDMPKNKVAAKPTDDLTVICSKHKKKLIEYWCNSHKDLCCVICLKTDHDMCKSTSHIPDVSDRIARSKEYKTVMTGLKAFISKVTTQQKKIKLNNNGNDKYQSKSLAGIRDFRKAIDKLMDKYEENAVMKVSELHHANAEKIKAASSECQGVLSDVTAMIANLDAKAKDGKQNQLFVDVKLSKQRLSGMEAEAKDVTDCRITRYGFHQDEKMKAMVSTLSAAWSLSIRQDGEETKARYIDEVNVKSDDDTNDCIIDGIAVLPGGDIVMTDFNNKTLKLVDMKLNKVKNRVPLSSEPFDVTNTKQNDIAVTLGNEGKIEMYTVTDVLSLSNTIPVEEKGFCGVCYADEKFILTCGHKGLVKIVDMSGRVLSTISTDKNEDRLFTMPRHIAIGRYGDIIYVNDREAHTVTTMTLGGHVISVYRNGKLKCPLGVTVSPDHKVYVCSRDTHTVLQLTATGEFQQVLLDKQRGLAWFPLAIAYDDTSDRLFISTHSSKPDDQQF